MKLLFRLILISMFGFAYSNCWDIDNQADCMSSDHCEWYADDSACEDAEGDHDDHDHGEEEHCEDFVTEADCGMHSECEWHADEDACEDAEGDHDGHDHGDEEHGMHITIEGVSVGTMEFQFSLMHEGHSDFTSLPIVVNVVE